MYLSDLYIKVQEALRRKDSGKAISILKDQILHSYPEEIKARKLLRGIELELFKEHGPPKILTILCKCFFSWLRLFYAWILRRWDSVLLEAENLLVFAPRNREILFFLGEAATKLSYLDTAIFAFRSILAVDTHNLKALKILARLSTRQEKWEEALKYYQHAVLLKPKDKRLSSELKKATARQNAIDPGVSKMSYVGKWSKDYFKDVQSLRPEDIRKAIVKGDARLAMVESKGWATAFEPKWLQRRIGVLYFAQMNLFRIFPLLITISEKNPKNFSQDINQVPGEDYLIEVIPQFPGCHVTPISAQSDISSSFLELRFMVSPVCLGEPLGARLIIKHQGKVVEEIPTPIRTTKLTLAKLLILIGVLLPFLTMVVDSLDISLRSQIPILVIFFQKIVSLCGGIIPVGLLFSAVFIITGISILFFNTPKESEPRESIFEIEVTPPSDVSQADEESALPPQLEQERQQLKEKILKLNSVLDSMSQGKDEAGEADITDITWDLLYETPKGGPEYEHAIAWFKKKLKENPKDANLILRLGSLYQCSNRYEDAIDLYTKILEIDPANVPVNIRIGDCMIAKLGQRINSLKSKLELTPNDVNLQNQLKDAENEKLDYEIEEYESRINLEPESIENHYRLAMVLSKKNRFYEAIDHFHKASKAPRYKTNSYIAMGQSYMYLNDYDLAQSYFLSALSEIPHEDERYLKIMYNLGRSHESSGEIDRAIKVYREICEQDSDYEDVSLRLAKLVGS